MNSSLDPDILQQIQAILRRDLKLAADEPLPAEMALFGSSVDLDSLDMLLLLTSIERAFGVRITSQAVGKEVFQNVGSLASYVQEHRGQGPVAAAAAPAESTDWLAKLPHGPEFRFLTRIHEVIPGEIARGVWKVDGTEHFFAGHFPGDPIVPGVLIAEALAQISGIAGPAGAGRQGKLVQVDIRFEHPVRPPAEIELRSKVARIMGPIQIFEVVAKLGSIIVAQGSITLHRSGEPA